tara:strand:+ start:134 stop:256 length:123 start_codon:yes stop_codon:yes gene_type:complete
MISNAKLQIRRSKTIDAKNHALVDQVVGIVNAKYCWPKVD